MPRAKKTKSSKSRSKAIPQPALSKAYETEMSYETRVIVVILLLLFVYPIGLICMWAWMRDWPMWLKLLISLPLLLGILAFFTGVILLGSFIGTAGRAYRMQQMHQKMEWQASPTNTPSDTTTPSVNNTSPYTY